MTHQEYLAALHFVPTPKCKQYFGWFAFQDLEPNFAMSLMYDLVSLPIFMREIDGKVYVSTQIISAYAGGDNDWLDDGEPLNPSIMDAASARP